MFVRLCLPQSSLTLDTLTEMEKPGFACKHSECSTVECSGGWNAYVHICTHNIRWPLTAHPPRHLRFVPRHLCQVVPEMIEHYPRRCVGFLKSLPRDQRSAVRSSQLGHLSFVSRNDQQTGSSQQSPAFSPSTLSSVPLNSIVALWENRSRTGCGRCPTSVAPPLIGT